MLDTKICKHQTRFFHLDIYKKTYLKFTKTSFVFFVDFVLLNWASNVCQGNQ